MENIKFRPLREGSSFEVPNFFGNEAAPQIALESEFSKSRRDRAFARAFVAASMDTPGSYRRTVVAFSADACWDAFHRLWERGL
jgi:hypothetical protein